jgi:hypothetical protein
MKNEGPGKVLEGGSMAILGISIGGSGVKAAPVDLGSGALLAERYRVEPRG